MPSRTRLLTIVAALAPASGAWAASPYCVEVPTAPPSRSVGAPASGRLEGGVRIQESATLRVMPLVHRERCLFFGVGRLVHAVEAAADAVARAHPGSPPLGVGDIARARGGPIPAYSHSHQSGRDADLAFYVRDGDDRPVPAESLTKFDGDGRARDGSNLKFDVERNWSLVAALLSDPGIRVRWIFVSAPLRERLLVEARRRGAGPALIQSAELALHQPSDAPPHDDHLHLRIACSAAEVVQGCRG